MLRCAGGSLYTGRLAEHSAGGKKGAKYTKNHAPEAVAALWRVENRSMALRAEWYIKHLTRQKKQFLCEIPEKLPVWSGIEAEVITFRPASGTFSA